MRRMDDLPTTPKKKVLNMYSRISVSVLSAEVYYSVSCGRRTRGVSTKCTDRWRICVPWPLNPKPGLGPAGRTASLSLNMRQRRESEEVSGLVWKDWVY